MPAAWLASEDRGLLLLGTHPAPRPPGLCAGQAQTDVSEVQILFIFRQKKGKAEREEEKHERVREISVGYLSHFPNWGPSPQPSLCPGAESNRLSPRAWPVLGEAPRSLGCLAVLSVLRCRRAGSSREQEDGCSFMGPNKLQQKEDCTKSSVLFHLEAELGGKVSHRAPEIYIGDGKSCMEGRRTGCVSAGWEKPALPKLSHSHLRHAAAAWASSADAKLSKRGR